MAGNFSRAVGGATSGISQALGALLQGDRLQKNAYDGEMLTQSKLAAALAQVRASDAAAKLHEAQAADVTAATQRAAGRSGLLDTAVAGSLGIDVPTLNAERQRLTTGQAPMVPMGPPTEDGGMGLGSMQLAPETRSRIGQALLRMVPGYTAEKDINPAEWAQAMGAYRASDLSDDVMAGRRDAGAVGRAQAASGATGKVAPLYHTSENGAVLDLFGGGLNESGGLARGNIALIGAKTKEQQAAAQHQLAGADAQRASAAKSRAETTQITSGPKGVLVQTDAGPVFADPRSGASVPVLGPDGKPAGQKLKDIPPAQNTALIENAKALGNIDDVIAEITRATGIQLDANGKPVRAAGVNPSSPNALGGMNYLPEALRQRMDPEGIPVRAKIANIAGQRFHDLSGAAVSVGEAERLKPFIPDSRDSAPAVLQKLTNLRREYQLMQDQLNGFYSPANGYKAPPTITPAARAPNGQKVVNVDF